MPTWVFFYGSVGLRSHGLGFKGLQVLTRISDDFNQFWKTFIRLYRVIVSFDGFERG